MSSQHRGMVYDNQTGTWRDGTATVTAGQLAVAADGAVILAAQISDLHCTPTPHLENVLELANSTARVWFSPADMAAFRAALNPGEFNAPTQPPPTSQALSASPPVDAGSSSGVTPPTAGSFFDRPEVAVLAGVAMAVSVFLTWLTIAGRAINGTESLLWDEVDTMNLGVVAFLLGAAVAAVGKFGRPGTGLRKLLPILAGAATIVGFVSYSSISGAIYDYGGSGYASVGSGVLMFIAASVVALISSIRTRQG